MNMAVRRCGDEWVYCSGECGSCARAIGSQTSEIERYVEPKKRTTEESCIVHGMAKPNRCRWCRLMKEGSRDGVFVSTCSIRMKEVNLDQLPDWCPIEEA